MLQHSLNIELNRSNENSLKENKDIKLICGDTNNLIHHIPNESIDLIATDPPYEINFEGNYWDKPNQLNWHFLSKEFKRVLKPKGSLIIFQGWSNVSKTKEILDQHFTMKNWIIYDRVKGRGAKTNFVSTREDILWYVMNEDKYTYNKIPSTIKKKTGGMGKKNGCDYRALSNVWSDISPLVPWSPERIKHPTQKPIQIMNRIIEIHSNKDDLIFDPFFGSGTTAISSAILKRKFIGIECNKEYYNLSKKRLEDLWMKPLEKE